MTASDFSHLSPDLQEKIRQSREAFEIAARLSEQLKERFEINDVTVAATMQKTLTVSGSVQDESEKMAISEFLKTAMPEWTFSLSLATIL